MKISRNSTHSALYALAVTLFTILAIALFLLPQSNTLARAPGAPDALTYIFNKNISGGNGGFVTPLGIAHDTQGHIYVTDSGTSRVQVFDAFDNYLANFGTGLDFPYGIVVDGSGNIYVSDYNLNKIFKFDSSYNLVTQWGSTGSGDGQFKSPTGLALDSTGTKLYVADEGNYRIQIFNANGVFLKKFGKPGTGDGQFAGPYGVTVDTGGNIYVADTGNNRLEKFNKKYKWVKTWGSKGKGNGQFNTPRLLALDGVGRVFVSDSKNNRIQILDKNGVFLGKFGKKGSGDGQLIEPTGVTVSPDGNILHVTDRLNARVQLWYKQGFVPPPPPTTVTPTNTRTSTPTITPTPTSTPTPSCVPLPSGALSWWRGEDNANDTISTFNGSMHNGATFGTGKVGHAFSFDGVDDYVSMVNHANPASITVEGWVVFAQLPPTGQYQMPFSTYDGAFGGWHMIGELENGTLHPAFTVHRKPSFAQDAYSPDALPLNTWVHLAGTYDGSVVKIFVNGIEKDSKDFAGGYSASSIDMRIGSASWADTGFLPGLVDELTVYDRALSASEIASIYNAGSFGKCVP